MLEPLGGGGAKGKGEVVPLVLGTEFNPQDDGQGSYSDDGEIVRLLPP